MSLAPCLECAALVPSVALGDEPPLPLGECFVPRGIFYGENLQKLRESRGRWAQPWVETQPTPPPTSRGLQPGVGGPPAQRRWDVLGVPWPQECPLYISPEGCPCPVWHRVAGWGEFCRCPPRVGAAVPLSHSPAPLGRLRNKGQGHTWSHPSLSQRNRPPQPGCPTAGKGLRTPTGWLNPLWGSPRAHYRGLSPPARGGGDE